MDENVTRYPLSWPTGWPRTPAAGRRVPRFGTKGLGVGVRAITVGSAIERLDRQLDRLGGGGTSTGAILSTNLRIGLRGDPLSGQPEPSDPGAAVYFELRGKARVLACDRWVTAGGNIAAMAAHVDAIRAVERYGVGTLDQAFAGYDALPPPGAGNRPPWRSTLGFKPLARATVADVNLNYRALAKRAVGLAPGDESRLLELNLAREAALRELEDKQE